MELRDFNYENREKLDWAELRRHSRPHLAVFLPSFIFTTTSSLKVLQSIQAHRCLGVAHQGMNLVGGKTLLLSHALFSLDLLWSLIIQVFVYFWPEEQKIFSAAKPKH